MASDGELLSIMASGSQVLLNSSNTTHKSEGVKEQRDGPSEFSKTVRRMRRYLRQEMKNIVRQQSSADREPFVNGTSRDCTQVLNSVCVCVWVVGFSGLHRTGACVLGIRRTINTDRHLDQQ